MALRGALARFPRAAGAGFPWNAAAAAAGRRMLANQRFPVPNMGDSISEGTILELTKAVGDHVAMEEVIAQIETDKVVVDVRSPAEGKVVGFFAKPEDVVLVGADLIEIDVGAEGATASAPPADAEVPAAPTAAAPASASAATPRRVHASGRPSLISFPPRGKAAQIAAATATQEVKSTASPAPQAPLPKLGTITLDGVPERFRRKQLSEDEMDAIDSGGAGYVF